MVQTKLPSVYDDVFSLSPMPLQAACLGKITQQLPALVTSETTKTMDDDYEKKLRFKQDITLPAKVAERVLEDLSNNGLITNATLSLFSEVNTYNLKVLKLNDIDMNIAGKTLMLYSNFSFREVSLGCNTSINRWSMRKLADSFAGSRLSLTNLKIDLYPGVNIAAGTIFDFFVQFPNVKSIDYNTPILGNNQSFTNQNWQRLLNTCTQLTVLRISINGSSKYVELDSEIFLRGMQLQSLSLYSALKSDLAVESFACLQHFVELENLRELDLSIDLDPPDANLINLNNYDPVFIKHKLSKHIDRFLELSTGKLKLLESLDVSGIYLIDDMRLQIFIEAHGTLRFLGLCMLQSKFCTNGDAVAYYPHLKIAGCYLEEQIIVSLLKYSKRATYMKEVLKGLFQITAGWTDVRRPYVLKLVLDIMKEFKSHMQLQMAATACVFHLTKERDLIKNELNYELLSEVARVTSMILVTHVGNLQMVKNCLLIVCTDRILHHARFDRVVMSRLCLNCMLNHPENVDRHVTRMAVAIISILACKISSADTAKLMKKKQMKLLLDIVDQRLSTRMIDGTLKFNLSALWNLTDESPAACSLFVDLSGPAKYLSLLEVFEANVHVETKVLGLLNNIAEVRFLQYCMLQNKPLMERIRFLIGSKEVQVSYFACGIIANLALRWDDVYTVLTIPERLIMLKELEEAIERWGRLDSEIVTYRSFKPFHELLCNEYSHEIQRWAVWAVHHVCSLCAKSYKDLMDEKCLSLLQRIYNQEINAGIKEKIVEIFEVTGNLHLLNTFNREALCADLGIVQCAKWGI